MVKAIFPLIIIALLSVSTAHGTEPIWELVTQGTPGVYYYVDTQNISYRSKNIRRAWRKTTDSVDYKIDYDLIYQEFDCTEKKTSYLQISQYFKNGEISSKDVTGKWSYEVPGSVGMKILEYVCAEGSRFEIIPPKGDNK